MKKEQGIQGRLLSNYEKLSSNKTLQWNNFFWWFIKIKTFPSQLIVNNLSTGWMKFISE